MRVNFEHPANAGILRYLKRRRQSLGVAPSMSPESVHDPYYNLGTHPDLVAWLWDEITARLPMDCRWVVYRTPVLVHPETGIIFGFAGGTHTYAFRLPERERHEALQGGAKRVHRYSDGSSLDLADIGEEWVFGNWSDNEPEWCEAAFRFAGETV